MTAWRALVRKDLRLFFRDRRAVLVSIVTPIAIASFFGYALGGMNSSQSSKIPVLVVDQDGSDISKEIAARLAKEQQLDVMPATPSAAREQVRKGSDSVAVVIPPGFGADAGRAFFGAAAKPTLDVLYDPSQSAEQGMVKGILTGEVMQVISKEMFSGKAGSDFRSEALQRINDGETSLDADQRKALTDLLRSVDRLNLDARPDQSAGGGLTVPYETREEAVTSRANVKYNGYAHAFAGMGIQFILFLGIDVGVGLLVVRQRGLWRRFRAAPLSRAALLGSRAVSAAITSMLVLMILFGFARLVFGVHIEGSMAGFLAICMAFSLMTAAFGLLIAALGKTPEATRGLAIFVTLIMVMLGGAWVPAFIFPQWLQKMTLAVPTRWAMDGLDAMTWRGLGFSSAIAPAAILLFCAVLFGLLALARFRWEES